MSTSGKLQAYVATLMVVALAIVGFAFTVNGDVNPPIFLTRLANVIKTYPATAQLVVGGAFTQGGTIHATSTATGGSVAPLIASNFDEETTIDLTPNMAPVTLSFPASSTLASDFLPTAGMKRTLYVRNASTTATAHILVTGGTGMLLKRSGTSTAATIFGDTDAGNFARIDLVRKANTDIEMLVTTFND